MLEFSEISTARNPLLYFLASVLLATAAPSLSALAENSARITGRASVVDGDTIEIDGERIRFNGIDAPESAQVCLDAKGKKYRCGVMSANALDKFLSKSSPITCAFVQRDRYGRFVGNCFRVDGTSVQEWLVLNGLALDWERYSGGAYAKLQSRAREHKSGLWAGSFVKPWDWRASRRAPTVSLPIAGLPPRDSGGCKIKGNISTKGEHIFHVPGQEHYARTEVSEKKGERWFCTVGDAISAGWRPAAR